jgi:hypothetical protein
LSKPPHAAVTIGKRVNELKLVMKDAAERQGVFFRLLQASEQAAISCGARPAGGAMWTSFSLWKIPTPPERYFPTSSTSEAINNAMQSENQAILRPNKAQTIWISGISTVSTTGFPRSARTDV